MANLEKDILASTNYRPRIWWRYIDDIFTILEHGQEALNIFLKQINHLNPTINFTMEMSTKCVSFLDTIVILADGILHTDLYTKQQICTSTCECPQTAATLSTAPPQYHTVKLSDLGGYVPGEKTLRGEQIS